MSVKSLILLIEDHKDIIDIVAYNLMKAGFDVEVATDGMEGIQKATKLRPDLILLDLLLPKKSGLDVCKELRKHSDTSSTPIIMVTAKGEEEDIVRGLELGADDYMTKPFSPKELNARVHAVLRRSRQASSGEEVVRIKDLMIDPGRYEIRLRNEPIKVTRAEFRLLRALAASPGQVFTRDQLIEKIGGPDIVIVDRNIDVHVSAVRRKLKDYGKFIITIRGIGYKCEADESF